MKVIRSARFSDARAAADILNAAVRRTAAAGQPIWESEKFDAKTLSNRIVGRELFLCTEDARPAATFQLMREDLLHWPLSKDRSFYLHKIAVDDHAMGQGWLRDILQWTEKRAREHGMQFIRLDTIAGGRLQQLYQEFGFQDRGPSPAPAALPLVLLERQIRTSPERRG